MQVKIKAFILSYTVVGDHDLVLRTFTELHGKLSFYIHRYKGKKSGIKPSLLMPLMPVEIETLLKPNTDLQKLSESRSLLNGLQLYQHPYKLAQCYFMAELLQNIHFEAVDHSEFFEYMLKLIESYDQGAELDAMLPIHWLCSLLGELGLKPSTSNLDYPYLFDIKEAEFTALEPIHPHFLNAEHSFAFNKLLNNEELKLNLQARSQILHGLIEFLQIHTSGFKPPKSLQVYSEMLG